LYPERVRIKGYYAPYVVGRSYGISWGPANSVASRTHTIDVYTLNAPCAEAPDTVNYRGSRTSPGRVSGAAANPSIPVVVATPGDRAIAGRLEAVLRRLV